MAPDVFSCPECGVALPGTFGLAPGARGECPRCHAPFTLPPAPEEGADGPEPGYSTAPRPVGGGAFDHRRDSAATRRAGDEPPPQSPSTFDRPEYDEDYDPDYPSARRGPVPGELRNDYQVDLGRWFSLGLKHWTAFMGPFIGFAFVFMLAYLVLCILIPAMPFVLPHLAVGPYVVAMKMLKGRPWTFGDFFGGFSWYRAILISTLLSGLVYLVCMTPYFVAYGYVVSTVMQEAGARGQPKLPGVEAPLILIAGMAVSMIPVTYFQVRYFWAIHLILDRHYGGLESLKGSWRLTRNRFWITFGILLLMQLVNNVGASACYVGLLFSLPLTILVITAGYLLIAGSEPPIPPEEVDRRRRRSAEDEEGRRPDRGQGDADFERG